MIKRQQRIDWIAAVEKEYFAAKSAAELLQAQLRADPNYGRSEVRSIMEKLPDERR